MPDRDGNLTLADVQRTIDHFLDQARDCCEVCGAPAPRALHSPSLVPGVVFEVRVVGGCEHRPPESIL